MESSASCKCTELSASCKCRSQVQLTCKVVPTTLHTNRPSAGIGVVEVQKFEVFFCDFCGALILGSCLVVRAPAPGTGGSRVRFLLGPRAGVASCTEQLAYSNLRRATCTEQLAPSNLRRATCTHCNLHRATCAKQLAQASLRRHLAQSNLRRATCAEQLAHTATCTEQLAQSNLRRATCACPRRWADLACDVMLSGQPWSSSHRYPCQNRTDPFGRLRPTIWALHILKENSKATIQFEGSPNNFGHLCNWVWLTITELWLHW